MPKSSPLRRLIVAALETPLVLVLSFATVYIAATMLAFGRPPTMMAVPDWLFTATAISALIGGIVTFGARVLPAEYARSERAGLALLSCAYSLFPTYFLARYGLSWNTANMAVTDYSIALGFGIRLWTVGIALRVKRKAQPHDRK